MLVVENKIEKIVHRFNNSAGTDIKYYRYLLAKACENVFRF